MYVYVGLPKYEYTYVRICLRMCTHVSFVDHVNIEGEHAVYTFSLILMF